LAHGVATALNGDRTPLRSTIIMRWRGSIQGHRDQVYAFGERAASTRAITQHRHPTCRVFHRWFER
jgi:hypothetical protein